MNPRDSMLLEDMDHKLDALLEGQGAMGYVPRKIDVIDERLKNVESDVKAMKAVLTDHSSELADLKQAVA